MRHITLLAQRNNQITCTVLHFVTVLLSDDKTWMKMEMAEIEVTQKFRVCWSSTAMLFHLRVSLVRVKRAKREKRLQFYMTSKNLERLRAHILAHPTFPDEQLYLLYKIEISIKWNFYILTGTRRG